MDAVLSPSPILFDRRGRAPHRRDLGPARAAPRCGARTRGGGACRSPCVHGRPRCYLHGGAPGSGAPLGNRNAWKHGAYGRAALARRRALRALCREAAFVLGLAEYHRTGKARHLPKRLPGVAFLEGLARYNRSRRGASSAGLEPAQTGGFLQSIGSFHQTAAPAEDAPAGTAENRGFLQSMGLFRETAAPAEDTRPDTAENRGFLQSMGSIRQTTAPAEDAPAGTAEKPAFLQSKGSFREAAPPRPRQRPGGRAWPRVHPRWRGRPVEPPPDGVPCEPPSDRDD